MLRENSVHVAEDVRRLLHILGARIAGMQLALSVLVALGIHLVFTCTRGPAACARAQDADKTTAPNSINAQNEAHTLDVSALVTPGMRACTPGHAGVHMCLWGQCEGMGRG